MGEAVECGVSRLDMAWYLFLFFAFLYFSFVVWFNKSTIATLFSAHLIADTFHPGHPSDTKFIFFLN